MPAEYPDYGRIDEALLAAGLGLVVLGTVGLGLFEMALGSAHVTQRIPGVGVVTLHTSFAPNLRAAVVALGFLVLSGWSFSRVGRAVLG